MMKQAQTTPDMAPTTRDASFGPLVRVLLILRVLYIVTNYIWVLSATRRCGEGKMGYDDDSGPKRHIWCCLGLWYVFYFNFYIQLIAFIKYQFYERISIFVFLTVGELET